jgi:hypothetical protein
VLGFFVRRVGDPELALRFIDGRSASLAQGRLLVGVVGSELQVYYLVR